MILDVINDCYYGKDDEVQLEKIELDKAEKDGIEKVEA